MCILIAIMSFITGVLGGAVGMLTLQALSMRKQHIETMKFFKDMEDKKNEE